jgi:DNA-binding response OmpR family regulator
MRRRRVVIYDDETMILNVLANYFSLHNYEVITFKSPVVCPIDDNHSISCDKVKYCADIIISDLIMPGMTGEELFNAQSLRKCKVPVKNKAIMSGSIGDDRIAKMRREGYKIFSKPISFDLLSQWINELEPEMDLSQPLGTNRKEHRRQSTQEITCILVDDTLTLKGIAMNISPSGLCVKIDAPVIEKQKLSVLCSHASDYRPAFVCWKRSLEKGYYLAGLSFV